MIHRAAGVSGVVALALFLASPVAGQVKTKAASHDLAGKDNCLMCHAPGVMPPAPDVPENHEGRGIEVCKWCHAPDSPMVTKGAPQFTHDPTGKDNCLMCHAAGVMPPAPDVPQDHEGRGIEVCKWCHTKAGG